MEVKSESESETAKTVMTARLTVFRARAKQRLRLKTVRRAVVVRVTVRTARSRPAMEKNMADMVTMRT